jgi:hypothetical protein
MFQIGDRSQNICPPWEDPSHKRLPENKNVEMLLPRSNLGDSSGYNPP